MADSRVVDLPASGEPDLVDLLYMVDVSADPPRDRRLSVGNLLAAVRPITPIGTRVSDLYLHMDTDDSAPHTMISPFLLNYNSTAIYHAYVVARQEAGGDGPGPGGSGHSAAYELKGSVYVYVSAPLTNTAVLHSGIFKTAFKEDNPTWDVTITVGPSSNLNVVVTGAEETTINWFCHLHIVEVAEYAEV